MLYLNVLLAFMIIISFLGAIALHEFGHAMIALLLGDRTPQADGRQTLSLRTHIDPVGLLMCILLAFQPLAQMGFGWGNPVKTDPWKMRGGENVGLLLVAIGGILFSLLIGLLTALVLHFVYPFMSQNIVTIHISQFLLVFATVNISVAFFNLLPLYPLDGYQIVYALLPSKQAVGFARSVTYGPFIILFLFFFLPFLARLANMGNFPLFQLANYILLGAHSLIALIVSPGDFVQGYNIVALLYSLP